MLVCVLVQVVFACSYLLPKLARMTVKLAQQLRHDFDWLRLCVLWLLSRLCDITDACLHHAIYSILVQTDGATMSILLSVHCRLLLSVEP